MIIYVIGLTRFATMTATTTIATTRRDKARIKIPPKGWCSSPQCCRNDSSAISQHTLPITKPINFHRKSIIHHRKPFGEVLTVKYYAFVAHEQYRPILSYGALLREGMCPFDLETSSYGSVWCGWQKKLDFIGALLNEK